MLECKWYEHFKVSVAAPNHFASVHNDCSRIRKVTLDAGRVENFRGPEFIFSKEYLGKATVSPRLPLEPVVVPSRAEDDIELAEARHDVELVQRG